MEKPPLIKFIEDRFGRKAPAEPMCKATDIAHAKIRDGCSVVIIGGGIAGPAFARRILSTAAELDIRVDITLISKPSCNYCGGLVTDLALQTMKRLYEYEPDPEVVLSEIDEAVLVNPEGSTSVAFDSPLASVFRTGRFGQVGLDDDFRLNILADLPESAQEMLTVIEPSVATSVELPGPHKRGKVTFMHSGGTNEAEADLIVVATGLRSLNSKFLSGFCKTTGYRPPRVMPACVTEIDVSHSGSASIGRRMLILKGIVEGAVVALIPKQLNWITVASLQKVLTRDDLLHLLTHPAVKDYIQIDNLEMSLPCNRVCTSSVFTGPAKNFYGDGWVVVGDLTGYGRVLKDGYFAALLGADLAAHTAIMHGCLREDFARHYHSKLKRFNGDNRNGMLLFELNNRLTRSKTFNRVLLGALSEEKSRHPYGGLAHAAFRALSTGILSYTGIGIMFVSGLIMWALKAPFRLFGGR